MSYYPYHHKQCVQVENTVVFTVKSPSAEHQFVNALFLTYNSPEEFSNLITRLHSICIKQNNVVLHDIESDVWARSMSLFTANVIKSKNNSLFYLPLWCSGLRHMSNIEFPIEVTLKFKTYQEEHERCGIYVQYGHFHDSSPYYWTFSKTQRVPIPETEEKMHFELDCVKDTRRLGAVIIYLENRAIVSCGKLTQETTPFDPEQKTLYEFSDVYEVAAIDKMLFEFIQKVPLLTMSFCTWTESPNGLPINLSPYSYTVHLGLEKVKDDIRPNFLECFGVVERKHEPTFVAL